MNSPVALLETLFARVKVFASVTASASGCVPALVCLCVCVVQGLCVYSSHRVRLFMTLRVFNHGGVCVTVCGFVCVQWCSRT